MGLSRQEYWSGLPFPFPGDLPLPGMGLSLKVSSIGRQVLYHRTTRKAPRSTFKKISLKKSWGFDLKAYRGLI
jgi:hypothetical protein